MTYRFLMIAAISVIGLIARMNYFFCAVSGQEKASQPVSVYVAALKGECAPERPVAITYGRTMVMPPNMAPSDPSTSGKTILTRFLEDPISRHLAEDEFRKNKAFRVVDSPAQADFVFCLCSQYREMRIPPEMQRRLNVPAILRVWTQASVVSVERYLKTPHDPKALTEAAFWRSDSQTIEAGEQSGNENEKDKKKRKEKKDSNPNPPGGSVPGAVVNGQPVMLRPEALPYDLVKRFIKRWPAFAATISAQPKPQPAVAASPSETPRPKMATDPLAPPANDTPPKTEAAPPDSSALRIETALVIVPVMAMDKEGKYLPGLKAGDFEVYEDGVKQEISDFGSAETPFHVALVLDVSGSTRFKLEDIQDAAMSFVDQLRPQDRVMVISFDHQVRVDTEFTNERDKLMRAILRTRPGGATRLQDALDLTLTERLNKIQGRKAIVVFTDGVDNTSWLASWQDVTARVEESGVIVYPVRYDTLPDVTALPRMSPLPPNVKVVRVVGQDKEEYERAVRSLKNLASVSGGRYYDVATIADTKQAFANIAEELRRYYWLGYYPANTARDGRYRKIRVTVNRPEVVVRARDGYRTTTGEGKQ